MVDEDGDVQHEEGDTTRSAPRRAIGAPRSTRCCTPDKSPFGRGSGMSAVMPGITGYTAPVGPRSYLDRGCLPPSARPEPEQLDIDDEAVIAALAGI